MRVLTYNNTSKFPRIFVQFETLEEYQAMIIVLHSPTSYNNPKERIVSLETCDVSYLPPEIQAELVLFNTVDVPSELDLFYELVADADYARKHNQLPKRYVNNVLRCYRELNFPEQMQVDKYKVNNKHLSKSAITPQVVSKQHIPTNLNKKDFREKAGKVYRAHHVVTIDD